MHAYLLLLLCISHCILHPGKRIKLTFRLTITQVTQAEAELNMAFGALQDQCVLLYLLTAYVMLHRHQTHAAHAGGKEIGSATAENSLG